MMSPRDTDYWTIPLPIKRPMTRPTNEHVTLQVNLLMLHLFFSFFSSFFSSMDFGLFFFQKNEKIPQEVPLSPTPVANTTVFRPQTFNNSFSEHCKVGWL